MPLPLTLTLELTGTDPLQGRIGCGGTGFREFVGWIGLATILGEIVEPGPRTETDAEQPAPAGAQILTDEKGDAR